MKFICGNCGGVSKEGDISKHHASFVLHEECGHETFFDTHIPRKGDEDPEPGPVRKMGSEEEASEGAPTLPSAEDLDAVAEEERIREATGAGPLEGDAKARYEEALAHVMSRGYAKKAAKKLVAETGVDTILASKAADACSDTETTEPQQ